MGNGGVSYTPFPAHSPSRVGGSERLRSGGSSTIGRRRYAVLPGTRPSAWTTRGQNVLPRRTPCRVGSRWGHWMIRSLAGRSARTASQGPTGVAAFSQPDRNLGSRGAERFTYARRMARGPVPVVRGKQNFQRARCGSPVPASNRIDLVTPPRDHAEGTRGIRPLCPVRRGSSRGLRAHHSPAGHDVQYRRSAWSAR